MSVNKTELHIALDLEDNPEAEKMLLAGLSYVLEVTPGLTDEEEQDSSSVIEVLIDRELEREFYTNEG
jgi:hypothetical protein